MRITEEEAEAFKRLPRCENWWYGGKNDPCQPHVQYTKSDTLVLTVSHCGAFWVRHYGEELFVVHQCAHECYELFVYSRRRRRYLSETTARRRLRVVPLLIEMMYK